VTTLGFFAIAMACTSTVDRLHRDSSFQFEALQSGGLGIGGLASVLPEGEDDMELSGRTTPLLRRALMKKHPELPVTTWGEIRRRLGEEKMRSSLEATAKFGSLETETLHGIGDVLEGSPRYLAFARIEGDNTDQQERSSQKLKEDGSWKQRSQPVSSREVLVAFTIYDLSTAAIVVSADITGRGEAQGVSSKREDQGFLDTLLGSTFGSGSQAVAYPEPPSRDQLLQYAFERFATELDR
jgi:hypothetical protein